MQCPVKKIHITQPFGVNKDAYARFGLQGHNGIDYRAFLPNGERCYVGDKSEVFAPHDGVCRENVFNSGGYGWYIKIESDTQGSVLAHFSSQSPIKVGQTVKMGDFVGFQGTTGNSTGIHLHWGWYPVPRNRSNGFNGYENQEGKYKPYGQGESGDMISQEEYDKVRLERDKNWGLYQEELKNTKQLQDELNELAVKLKECQSATPPVSNDTPPVIKGWSANGLQVQVGDKIWNYDKV